MLLTDIQHELRKAIHPFSRPHSLLLRNLPSHRPAALAFAVEHAQDLRYLQLQPLPNLFSRASGYCPPGFTLSSHIQHTWLLITTPNARLQAIPFFRCQCPAVTQPRRSTTEPAEPEWEYRLLELRTQCRDKSQYELSKAFCALSQLNVRWRLLRSQRWRHGPTPAAEEPGLVQLSSYRRTRHAHGRTVDPRTSNRGPISKGPCRCPVEAGVGVGTSLLSCSLPQTD